MDNNFYLYLHAGITDILSGDVPKGTKILSRHLESLIELHNMTGAFAKNIQHLFSESDLQILLKTLKAVYSPYETFKLKCVLLSLLCSYLYNLASVCSKILIHIC